MECSGAGADGRTKNHKSSGKVVAKAVNGQYTAARLTGRLTDCLPAWLYICGGNGPNVTAGLLPIGS